MRASLPQKFSLFHKICCGILSFSPISSTYLNSKVSAVQPLLAARKRGSSEIFYFSVGTGVPDGPFMNSASQKHKAAIFCSIRHSKTFCFFRTVEDAGPYNHYFSFVTLLILKVSFELREYRVVFVIQKSGQCPPPVARLFVPFYHNFTAKRRGLISA